MKVLRVYSIILFVVYLILISSLFQGEIWYNISYFVDFTIIISFIVCSFNKELIVPAIRKIIFIITIVYSFVYNLILQPMISEEPLSYFVLIGFLMFAPIYNGFYKYSFKTNEKIVANEAD